MNTKEFLAGPAKVAIADREGHKGRPLSYASIRMSETIFRKYIVDGIHLKPLAEHYEISEQGVLNRVNQFRKMFPAYANELQGSAAPRTGAKRGPKPKVAVVAKTKAPRKAKAPKAAPVVQVEAPAPTPELVTA